MEPNKEDGMAYEPLTIDYKKHTIMGVDFHAVEDFAATASSLGSAMYEGFEPNVRTLEIARDYLSGKISPDELLVLIKRKEYQTAGSYAK